MIQITQSVELPPEVNALEGKGGNVVLAVHGRLGLYALNRTVEVLQEAAEELRVTLDTDPRSRRR